MNEKNYLRMLWVVSDDVVTVCMTGSEQDRASILIDSVSMNLKLGQEVLLKNSWKVYVRE